MNYEAYDIVKDECICSTTQKLLLIDDLKNYIEYRNHIDEDLITDEEIEELNTQALRKIGIKIYMNK